MFGPSKRELLRMLERERLAFAQERAALLERMADLAGRPMTPRGWDGMPADPFESALPDRPAVIVDADQLPKH